MKRLIIVFGFLILICKIGSSQRNNRVYIQFLGSTYSYYTLGYERELLELKESNLAIGTGASIWKSKSKSFVENSYPWLYKESPMFFHSSVYIKYTKSMNDKLIPHISLGSVYSTLVNKNNVGDSWRYISRLKEYSPLNPSLFLNIGSSFYFNEKIGVNLDAYLSKEFNHFDSHILYNYFFTMGIGIVYDF